jgi:hypothetical protein
LQVISGHQFEKSKKLMTILAIIYTVLFIFPFIVQLYSQNPGAIISCLVFQFLTQLFLLCIEFLQMRTVGWLEYKRDLWNFIEIGQSFFFLAYMILRIIDTSSILPDLSATASVIRKLAVSKKGTVSEGGGEAIEDDDYMVSPNISVWVIMNTLFVVQMIMKMMYFMRINGELAKLIKLVKQVFSDVSAFTLFLFGWVFVFVLLYQIAGIDLVVPSGLPYIGLNRGVALFI